MDIRASHKHGRPWTHMYMDTITEMIDKNCFVLGSSTWQTFYLDLRLFEYLKSIQARNLNFEIKANDGHE